MRPSEFILCLARGVHVLAEGRAALAVVLGAATAVVAALIVARLSIRRQIAAPERAAAAPPPDAGVGKTIAEALGPGMVRFFADAQARDGAQPSLSLVRPRPPASGRPAAVPIMPRFSVEEGQHVVRIAVGAGTSVYGTGEVPGPLLRNGRAITCWNTDAFAYGDHTSALYQSHPWLFCVRADGTALGILADTTWRCDIDLSGVTDQGGEIVIRADGVSLAVIAVERASPEQLCSALADLTGRISLPPRWALGYHQCRYSYFPASRVREIAREFRARAIPCDVIWHDIDYMRGFRCFTWHPDHFPDPAGLNAELHAQGFRTVWMIDPGIKAEPGFGVFDSGSAIDAWVRRADGSVYEGDVWPGACVFPDFTRADVRTWWAGLYADMVRSGADGVWNDMNEPAVFNTPDGSKTMPPDALHGADADLGGPGAHARYHNVYGMLMARATREGILRARPDRRPFVLSRANFLGGQRWAAAWTGDNTADWYHLKCSISMALNLGLSGQPFTGPDIGGFEGDGPPGEAGATLFARWMGIGTLLPFARGHANKGGIDKEPWALGTRAERTCREAIERRMMLLPFLYTLFREAATTGVPVVRPLFFLDPGDPALRAEDEVFLLGDRLAVVPVCSPGGERRVPGPLRSWARLVLPNDSRDRDLPELFLRPGMLIPVGPVVQHVDEVRSPGIALYAALDERGSATGDLYEDAGDGFDYQRGDYLLTKYGLGRSGERLSLSIVRSEGEFPRPQRPLRLVVYAKGGVLEATVPDGGPATVSLGGTRPEPPPGA